MTRASTETDPHAATESDATEHSTEVGVGRGVDVALAGEFERLCSRLGVATEPSGTQIDERYRIEQSLGQGAMGVVFRAWDERLGRRVAVKLVRAQARGDASLMQIRLEREAQLLARVDHRNVVGIHDVGRHAGRIYLAMQYVAGVTVRAWLKAERRRPREILDVFLQAARGLAAAHAGGIVHRDFKPDNVILGDDGIVRVLDFGIASALQHEEFEHTEDGDATVTLGDEASAVGIDAPTLAHITRTGAIMGTLPYMAPEQLRGSGVDERCDQFAFCIALWEALVGKRPFDARTPVQYYFETEERRLDPGELPRWLRPILSKGLAHDADDRWPNMNELIAALERGLERRQRLFRVGGVALGLPSAVLIGWMLAPSEAPAIESETCAEFVAQVDAVWGDAQRAELQRWAVLDPKAVGYARGALDALGEGWRARAETLCADELAPADDDPTRQCMQTWLTGFEHGVALLLEHGDLQTLVRAPDLLASLARSGDFCERAPTRPVEPELARLAREAREAAMFGDAERAESLALEASSRAETQLDGRSYTPELAEAHVARAEVALRADQFELAHAEFALAEQQAIGAQHWSVLLPTYSLWPKALILSDVDRSGERAAGHLDRALAFADSLALAPEDLRRVDLLEGRGLVLRAAGRRSEAIEQHRQARVRFEAAGQPVLAAKSLNNIGANYQELGDLEQALAAYREAAELLERAGVSERHPTLLEVSLNLGQLSLVEGDVSGLPHLQQVARLHPHPAARVRARMQASVLAYETEQQALAVELIEALLPELAAHDDLPADLLVEVELAAGIILASEGDPRGESLVHSAEVRADKVSLAVQVLTRETWIEWLDQNDRCDDARAALAILDGMVADREGIEATDYPTWRADQSASNCHSRSGE